MGEVFQAICECGFKSDELYLGGGMADMGKLCNVPYYCDNCEFVGKANIKNEFTYDIIVDEIKKGIKCEKCGEKVQYYGGICEDDMEDDIEDQEDFIFDWTIFLKRYFIEDKLYHCPKCKKVNIRFYSIACWD